MWARQHLDRDRLKHSLDGRLMVASGNLGSIGRTELSSHPQAHPGDSGTIHSMGAIGFILGCRG